MRRQYNRLKHIAFLFQLHIRPYNLIYTCIIVLNLNSNLGINAILFSDAIPVTIVIVNMAIVLVSTPKHIEPSNPDQN